MNVNFENSNFGIDLDGSNYCVRPFPPKFLLLWMGPKKYKISNSKFIVVRQDASDLIVIKREREPRSLSRIVSQYSHLLPKVGKLELKLLMSY